MLYDYGNDDTALWVFTADSNGQLKPKDAWDWRSGPGNWGWARSQLIAGNFRGTNKTDLAVLYDYGNDDTAILVFSTDASGQFQAPSLDWDSGPGNWGWARSKPVAGNFRGTGKADLAVLYDYGNDDTALWVFSADNTGRLQPGATWDWRSDSGNWNWQGSELTAGTFRAVGKTDIAILYRYPRDETALWVFTSDPTGHLQPASESPDWASGPGNWVWAFSKLAAGSFRGTGRSDIAVLYNYPGSPPPTLASDVYYDVHSSTLFYTPLEPTPASIFHALSCAVQDCNHRLAIPGITRHNTATSPDQQRAQDFRRRQGGDPAEIIELRGWVTPPGPNAVPNCTEDPPDFSYDLELDLNWLARINNGDPSLVNKLIRVGNILTHSSDNPRAAVSRPIVKTELMSWHSGQKFDSGQRDVYAPSGWTNDGLEWVRCPGITGSPLWQWNPYQTSGGQIVNLRDLPADRRYVRIVGALVTDDPHSLPDDWSPPRRGPANPMMAANNPLRWTEIHPPDLVELAQAPENREEVRAVAVYSSNCLIGRCASTSLDTDIPMPPNPYGSSGTLLIDEIMDWDHTNRDTLEEGDPSRVRVARVTPDYTRNIVHVHIRVRGQGGSGIPGKFKAIYRLHWVGRPVS